MKSDIRLNRHIREVFRWTFNYSFTSKSAQKCLEHAHPSVAGQHHLTSQPEALYTLGAASTLRFLSEPPLYTLLGALHSTESVSGQRPAKKI